MALLESVPEIVAGVAVELVVFSIAAAVVYRLFSGRFLIPKREIILPNQRGVVVQGDRVVRIADPGACWLRARQRVVLIDARPKPLQMIAMEVLGSDNGIVRLSLSAEYKVVDAAVYYSNSANAADMLFVQLRRIVSTVARQKSSGTLVSEAEAFSARVLQGIAEPAQRLGLRIENLETYEAVPLGFLRASHEASMDFPASGIVH